MFFDDRGIIGKEMRRLKITWVAQSRFGRMETVHHRFIEEAAIGLAPQTMISTRMALASLEGPDC